MRGGMPIQMLLIVQMAFWFLAGCASRDELLRGQNYTRFSVEAIHPAQIEKTAEAVFAQHGFMRVPATTAQELVLAKSGTSMLKFLKGGESIVWLVMEPRANGWDVYCVPQPDGLYTGGEATRFDRVLREIQAELSKPAARR